MTDDTDRVNPPANPPPAILSRPDIGACYCLPDDANRCAWESDKHEWVGPCARRGD